MSRFTRRHRALDTLLWLVAGVVALPLVPLLWLVQRLDARTGSVRRSRAARGQSQRARGASAFAGR